MRIEEYRLEPVKRSVIARQSLLLNLPIMIFYLGLFFYVYYRSAGTTLGSRFWMIWVPLVAYSVFSRIYRAYRKQDNVEGTFLLTITDDTVAAKQYGLKDIEFSYLEIRTVGKRPNGTIIITGGIDNRVITIPPAVESREQLIASLNNIMPVTEMGKPTKLTDRYRWVYLVLFFAVFMLFYISRDKTIVAITGPLLFIACIWSFVRTQRSRHLEDGVKKRGWFLLLPALVIAFKMYVILTNYHIAF